MNDGTTQSVRTEVEPFRRLVDSSPIVFWTTDRELRFTLSRGAGLAALGLRPDEVVGLRLEDYFQTGDPDHPALVAHRRALTGESAAFVFEFQDKHFEVYVSPLQSATGEVIGTTGLALDATAHRRTDQALRDSERMYRQMFELNQAVKLLIDAADGSIVDANPAAAEFYGYPLERLRTMRIFDINTAPAADVRRELERAAAAKRTYFQFRHRLADGEVRDVEIYSGPIDSGQRRLLFSIVHDVTERKRAESVQAALYRISELAGSATTDMGSFFAALHAIVGELMYARNFYVALLDEAAGEFDFPYYADEQDPPPGRQPLRRGLTERVLRSGQVEHIPRERFVELLEQAEVEVVGSPAVDWIGAPLRSGDRTFGVLAVQSYREEVRFRPADVEMMAFVSRHIATALERLAAERERQRSMSILRATLESTADGILVVDRQNRIVSFNQRFAEMWRLPPEVLAAGDDRVALRYVLDQLEDPEGFQARVHSLYRDFDTESSEALRFKDGRVFERYSRPQRIGGETIGRVWSFRDVTEQRHLQEQLWQSQKMEAVGRLAGGVAHDFNNLLTVISGYSELLLARLPAGSPLRADVEEIDRAGRRAADLTRQLLALSRRQVLQPAVLDLNSVVAHMEKLLGRVMGEDVRVRTRSPDDLWTVRADPGQMEQVLLNLGVNARDAMPSGGELVIETANVAAGADPLLRGTGLEALECVRLRVRDSGLGMEPNVRQHVFEPFFTTKPQGKGTGLGLATVYGIVRQSGGHIAVESEPRKGSTFSVYLPRVSAAVEAAAEPGVGAEPLHGHGRVLVVEDDAAVRALVARALVALGYQVIETEDGLEALAAFERCGGRIDVLLTDVRMPRMGGHELAQQLRERAPGLAILYVSGYADDYRQIQQDARQPAALFLQKPFTAEQLGRKMREVLEARRRSA